MSRSNFPGHPLPRTLRQWAMAIISVLLIMLFSAPAYAASTTTSAQTVKVTTRPHFVLRASTLTDSSFPQVVSPNLGQKPMPCYHRKCSF